MTKQEKEYFIIELVNTVKGNMLAKVDKLPERWDGLELRLYIASKFNDCVWGDIPKGRKRAFNNDMIVDNL